MVSDELLERANHACELCTRTDGLTSHFLGRDFADILHGDTAASVLCCQTCHDTMEETTKVDPNHWRCLLDSMWSQHDAVKVLSWQLLGRLSATEDWAQDALGQMYLEDDLLAIAQKITTSSAEKPLRHVDTNGTELIAGDSVLLIKDLTVKGANFTAKRGTVVRKISLVPDNPEQIEGRVNDQQIVILTKFVKKA